jgi:hypothetical protein
MNDRKKKYVCRNDREERERERDELFFSVCSRSAQFDFFSPSASQKKNGKKEKSRVQQ